MSALHIKVSEYKQRHLVPIGSVYMCSSLYTAINTSILNQMECRYSNSCLSFCSVSFLTADLVDIYYKINFYVKKFIPTNLEN